MAIHTHRTVTTTREEWHIPANPAGQLHIGDFSRAYQAARRAYRATHDLSSDQEMTDDALQVSGQEDGSVIISFEARYALAKDKR